MKVGRRRRDGAAGGPFGREAGGDEGGDRGGGRHRAHPPLRHGRHRGRRADGRGGARLSRPGRHPRQQRGALDPALGRALLRSLPRLRADDPAQLFRRGAADPCVAAGDAGAQVGPHHQRQLDRNADQPTALFCLRRLEGGAGRLQPGDRLRGDRRRRPHNDDPHAAGANADDRADSDVRHVPGDHARRRRRR